MTTLAAHHLPMVIGWCIIVIVLAMLIATILVYWRLRREDTERNEEERS